MATPFMIAVVGVFMSVILLGVETEYILGLEETAIQETLPLAAHGIENSIIAVQGMDEAEVEMDMQAEFGLVLDEGQVYIEYEEGRESLDTGVNLDVEEDTFETLCVLKDEEGTSLSPEAC